MQLQAESGRVEQGTFVTGLRKGAPPRITGVFDALAQIYRREGVTGLWRGVLANVMRSTLLVRASACWRPFSLHGLRCSRRRRYVPGLRTADGLR